MFDLKGYVKLKSDYSSDVFIGLNQTWQRSEYIKVATQIKDTPLRIIDIACDNKGYLCVSPEGNCIIDIRNIDDVACVFLCSECMEILTPPDLNIIERTSYALNIMGGNQ